MKFGDLVRVDLSESHGTEPSNSYVIGTMHYGADVLCVATEQAHGMPVNEAHCAVVSSGHDETCGRLRKRYLDTYGHHWFNPI